MISCTAPTYYCSSSLRPKLTTCACSACRRRSLVRMRPLIFRRRRPGQKHARSRRQPLDRLRLLRSRPEHLRHLKATAYPSREPCSGCIGPPHSFRVLNSTDAKQQQYPYTAANGCPVFWWRRGPHERYERQRRTSLLCADGCQQRLTANADYYTACSWRPQAVSFVFARGRCMEGGINKEASFLSRV